MPLHQLAVTPADVSGKRLGLALNAPAPAPLATYRLNHPNGGALLLGVLGASHVVAVEHAEGRFSEQVSCTARSLGVDLPERADAPGYCLQSRTETHDETTFRRLARELRERCANETGWLGGTFPGDDAALTALAAEPDGTGWRWQTWHLYPAGVRRDGGPHGKPMASVSRNRLFLIAGALAVAAVVSLIFGITLLNKNIASYIASHYHEYSRDANGTRYVCSGSPEEVADTLADYQAPEARAANGDNEYLRYSNNIVIVGPDGDHPCSIRVESLNAGYNHGAFIFLGPGFTPGSPSGGAGGTPGGPGGTK